MHGKACGFDFGVLAFSIEPNLSLRSTSIDLICALVTTSKARYQIGMDIMSLLWSFTEDTRIVAM